MLARELEGHEGVVFENDQHSENHYQFDRRDSNLASQALHENHSHHLWVLLRPPSRLESGPQ